MDHNYYKDRISAFADNALPPYEQMAVEGHLATCQECRTALAQIRKLGELIEKTGNLGENDFFENQAQVIEERLGIAPTKVTPITDTRTWRGLGWKLTAAAASIALVGIFAFYTKDSIWQKTDQPVVSPSIIQKSTEPASDTQSDQPLQEQAIPAPQIEGETRSGPEQGKKTVKTKAVDSIRQGMPEADMIAPEDDIILNESQSNYKDAPQTLAPAQEAMPEVAKEETLAKPVESLRRDTVAAVPAQRVDELLKSVAGVKTDSVGRGVYVRGGRAGEAKSRVDSTPPKDSLTKFQESGKANIAKATRDVVSKFDPSPLRDFIKNEQEMMTEAMRVAEERKSLIFWRTIRDSLEGDLLPSDSIEAQDEYAPRAEAPSLDAELTDKRATLDAGAHLLEAYFRIAQLSRDSVEVATVTDSLRKTAEDDKSPYQKTARAYLDSLGVK